MIGANAILILSYAKPLSFGTVKTDRSGEKEFSRAEAYCRTLSVSKSFSRAAPNVAFGSRLCKNVDAKTFCATIKSERSRKRIIVAA